MAPKKTAPAAAQQSLPATAPKAASTTTSASSAGRRPWIKKTPVEVVLEQINKQAQKVAEMREAITREERELAKLQQAKRVLEAD
jgi:hypothetical protein